MNRLARVLMSAAALVLAGCSSVPLTSIPPLARIDATTTDLSVELLGEQLPAQVLAQPPYDSAGTRLRG